MGKRIVAAVAQGDVAMFIATPGSANLQPRIEGAEKAIKDIGQADHTAHDRDRRRGAGRALDDRRLLDRPPEHEGDVRGRRRQHRGILANVMQKYGLPPKASRPAASI